MACKDFYNQFLNPIIEEVKASLREASALVSMAKNKHTLVLTVLSEVQNIGMDDENSIVGLSCSIGHFPTKTLKRMPNIEVIQYTENINGIERSINFIAENFDRDETMKYVACKLFVLRSHLRDFPNILNNSRLECSMLLGLMNYSRMYEVCKFPPNCNVVHQLMSGDLPQWNSNVSNYTMFSDAQPASYTQRLPVLYCESVCACRGRSIPFDGTARDWQDNHNHRRFGKDD